MVKIILLVIALTAVSTLCSNVDHTKKLAGPPNEFKDMRIQKLNLDTSNDSSISRVITLNPVDGFYQGSIKILVDVRFFQFTIIIPGGSNISVLIRDK